MLVDLVAVGKLGIATTAMVERKRLDGHLAKLGGEGREPWDLEMDWLVAISGSDIKEKESASSSSSSSRPKAPAIKDKDAEDIQDRNVIEATEIEEEARDQVAVGRLKPL